MKYSSIVCMALISLMISSQVISHQLPHHDGFWSKVKKAAKSVAKATTSTVNTVADGATGAANTVADGATGAANTVADGTTGAVDWVASRRSRSIHRLK